jgi:hypothetical protein
LQESWTLCAETIARLHQFNVVVASDLAAKVNIGPTVIWENQILCIQSDKYAAIDKTARLSRPITNFYLNIKTGTWFESEKEMWVSGILGMNLISYPFLIKAQDLEKSNTFISACRAIVYADKTESQAPQPVILYPEYMGGILKLIRQQIQATKVSRGISKLGWDQNCFITPTWFGDLQGLHTNATTLHPANSLLRSIYSFSKFRPNAVPHLSGAAGSITAVLIALIRRQWHGWPTLRINLKYTEATDRLLRAVFMPLNQIAPITRDWSKLEQLINGYPVFATHEARLPESCPAFSMGESGITLSDNPLSTIDIAPISFSVQRILAACIPFILKEKACVPEIPNSFFKLTQEGRNTIAACYGPIDIAPCEDDLLWRYFSEIPISELYSNATLDAHHQHLYLYFGKSNACRKLIRDKLCKDYPETEAVMSGDRYVRIKAVEGLELLQRFYGKNITLARKTMDESKVEGADFESTNLIPLKI